MSPFTKEDAPGIMSLPRLTTLFSSTFCALSSGTNYVYSAYAPQLGARLHITHTQLNIVGLAGNGVYSSGPIWGRIADTRGPRILLFCAFIFLLLGYTGIRHMYDSGLGPDSDSTISTMGFVGLILCSYLTGAGGNGGLTSGMNSTAKSFPDRARATTTGIVISGFGLSAFLFSTLSQVFFADNTSAFLLLLSLGTAMPMVWGFFFIKPIPLPPKDRAGEEGYIGVRQEEEEEEGGLRMGLENSSRVGLLDEERTESRVGGQGHKRYGSDGRISLAAYGPDALGAPDSLVSPSPSSAAVSARRRRSLSAVRAREVEGGREEEHEGKNVYGLRLFKTFDFWLLFAILSMLSGTGLMYINNVGSISQALFAHDNPAYDEVEAAKWQSTQVSVVSVMNFAGRIFIGLTADHIKHTHSLPRSFCLVIVSFFFFCSQVAAAIISDIGHLYISSALLGLAHGSVFSLFPTICIEFFGMPHFSENWGYVSTAPMLAGNLFSVIFGRNLDAHDSPSSPSSLSSSPSPSPSSPPPIDTWLAPRCLQGRECYVDTLYITIAATFLALLLSAWVGWRDWCGVGAGAATDYKRDERGGWARVPVEAEEGDE